MREGKDELTEVYVCRLKEDCPIYCKMMLDMYCIDSPVCVSRDHCPFQTRKILYIRHLPK